MKNLREMSIQDMPGIQYSCSCGRNHAIDIKGIYSGKGILNKIPEIINKESYKRIFLLADQNTYNICGDEIHEMMMQNSGSTLKVTKCILSWEDIAGYCHMLVPDEAALGYMLLNYEPDTDFILAIGAGVINDLARIFSNKTGIPYMIVTTAASMDGYASTVSPLIVKGRKITYPGVYPAYILADINVYKDAPVIMLQAGFGDILGKYNAITDWKLAQQNKNEHFCSECADLVLTAVQKCVDNAKGIQLKNETSVKNIMEALILSGIAMGLYGNSRPASGSEHHLAHYWEMSALAENQEHPLHGNSVAVGTVVSALVYEMMKDDLPDDIQFVSAEQIIEHFKVSGNIYDPKTLGISRALFHESILKALDVRDRYTIMYYAREKGRLKEIADRLTERFY